MSKIFSELYLQTEDPKQLKCLCYYNFKISK